MQHSLSRRSKISRLVPLLTAAVLVLAGCATTSPDSGSTAEGNGFLTEIGLADQSAKEIINTLDALPMQDRPDTFVASVRADSLLVINTADESQVELPIDGGEQYVSIAPFVTYTHDCYFHSLTTCVGEMQNEPLQVNVTDLSTGESVFEGDVTTFDNGFFGLWLPKNTTFSIDISSDNLAVSSTISTNADSATCITTLQLT